jgi:hypothetical protein
MKKLLFILLTLAVWQANAQHNSLSLDGYTQNTVLFTDGNTALIIAGGDTTPLSTVQNGSAIMISPRDTAKANAALALSDKNIQTIIGQYQAKYGAIGAASLLFNRAKELGGLMFLVEDTHGTSAAVDTVPKQVAVDDALPETTTQTSTGFLSTLPNWLWIPFAALSALLLGLWLTARGKGNAPVQVVNTTTTSVDANNLTQLQQKIDALSAALAANKKYSAALQEAIVTPARKALTNGNDSEAVQYAMQALYHLSAITNTNLEARSTSDIYNSNAIQGLSNASQLKAISMQTPADEVPKEIKTLLAILKQHNIADLSDTAILDYKIVNASS